MSDNNPFNILNSEPHSKELSPDSVSGELKQRIEKIINADNIVLFMKGNEQMPQCGFSANTVAILKHLDLNFTTFNILEDMDIRQGLKEYSNWPTFPQLYFKGKLVGGNDIITEMYESGDLQELLKEN
jgi:monothiol glutaredoxin